MKEIITGNMAVAVAAKLCRPQVIAVYPITPQTTVIEYLAKMVSSGELNAEYLKVESEHSAMAASIGAVAAGSRAFTATSSQGLLYMHEMLFQASGLRLPVVMVNVNRSVGSPWNIWTEQTDSLAQRDTGWIQFYCETNQEVLDSVIQAYRIAEAVSLPVAVISEGFVHSHTAEPIDIPEQEKVDAFLPPYEPKWKLDLENPIAAGGIVRPLPYAKMRKNIQEAMARVYQVKWKVDFDFFKHFERQCPAVEFLGVTKDPEILFVTSGTISGEVQAAIKDYPEISQLKIRMFRPFLYDIVRKFSWRAAKVVVLDRNISLGGRGVFAEAIKASLYDSSQHPPFFEYIVGIGGMDVTSKTIYKIIEDVSRRNYPKSPEPVWQSELEEAK